MTGDANLRLGDCYFMARDYSQAAEFYKKAILTGVPDADYANYQIGVSYGVQGDLQQKNNYMLKILNEYKKSSYTDDALYELGSNLTLQNRDAEALTYFKKIVKEYRC
jgi:TolA-binding protein